MTAHSSIRDLGVLKFIKQSSGVGHNGLGNETPLPTPFLDSSALAPSVATKGVIKLFHAII